MSNAFQFQFLIPIGSRALGDLTDFNAQRDVLLAERDILATRRDNLAAETSAGGSGNPFVFTSAMSAAVIGESEDMVLARLNEMQQRIDAIGAEVRALEAAQRDATANDGGEPGLAIAEHNEVWNAYIADRVERGDAAVHPIVEQIRTLCKRLVEAAAMEHPWGSSHPRAAGTITVSCDLVPVAERPLEMSDPNYKAPHA